MKTKNNSKTDDLIKRIKSLVENDNKKSVSQGARLISRNWKVWLNIFR